LQIDANKFIVAANFDTVDLYTRRHTSESSTSA